MIHTIIRDLDDEEMKTLIKCLGKLDIFSEKARGVTEKIWWLFVFTMSQPALNFVVGGLFDKFFKKRCKDESYGKY